MQAALPYIHIAFPALITVCIFIGTFGSQYILPLKYDGEDLSTRIYFYKRTYGLDYYVFYSALGVEAFGGCQARLDTVNAALAMGVIGCAFMLAAFACAIFLFFAPTNTRLQLGSRITQWTAAISIAVCLSLDVAFYVGSFCTESGSLQKNLNMDYGFILLIISMILVTILCIFDAVFPRSRGSELTAGENTPLYG